MPARFLYARFPADDPRAAADWMRTVDELAIGFAAAPIERRAQPAGPVLSWRLVSENRREIARGCRLFPGERQVQADIDRLLRGVDELEVHAAPAPRLRSHGWFVTRAGAIVMMGARRYEKRSAAEQSAALTIRALRELAALAGIAAGAPVDPAGPTTALLA